MFRNQTLPLGTFHRCLFEPAADIFEYEVRPGLFICFLLSGLIFEVDALEIIEVATAFVPAGAFFAIIVVLHCC